MITFQKSKKWWPNFYQDWKCHEIPGACMLIKDRHIPLRTTLRSLKTCEGQCGEPDLSLVTPPQSSKCCYAASQVPLAFSNLTLINNWSPSEEDKSPWSLEVGKGTKIFDRGTQSNLLRWTPTFLKLWHLYLASAVNSLNFLQSLHGTTYW